MNIMTVFMMLSKMKKAEMHTPYSRSAEGSTGEASVRFLSNDVTGNISWISSRPYAVSLKM